MNIVTQPKIVIDYLIKGSGWPLGINSIFRLSTSPIIKIPIKPE